MMVVSSDGTIYLNGAIVPRVVKHKTKRKSLDCEKADTLRAFTLVEMSNREVEKISEIWVLADGSRTEVQEESILFQNSLNDASVSASF